MSEKQKKVKEKLVVDYPRLLVCLGTLILAVLYYYFFDLVYDIAPYDAHLTDTVVFMTLEEEKMNLNIYMFYENKNKERERKQFLLFPIIADEFQKTPDKVEFKEKVLPENFDVNKAVGLLKSRFDLTDISPENSLDRNNSQENPVIAIDDPNILPVTVIEELDSGGYLPLDGELTDYGAKVWLNLGPSEKKVIKATFSQPLVKKYRYVFAYDFTNSKAWGTDLDNIFYFIYFPPGYEIMANDLNERKTGLDMVKFNDYPLHLKRFGALTCEMYGNITKGYGDKKGEVLPSCKSDNFNLYMLEYGKGYDPGIKMEVKGVDTL